MLDFNSFLHHQPQDTSHSIKIGLFHKPVFSISKATQMLGICTDLTVQIDEVKIYTNKAPSDFVIAPV